MKGTRLTAGLLLLPALASCGDNSDPHADQCAQVKAEAGEQLEAVDRLGDVMEKLKASGKLDSTVKTLNSGSWWYRGAPVPIPGPGMDEFNSARAEAVTSIRVYERIVVNNPSCFDATTVAKAQESLANSQ